jgi:hypothetical protein
MSSPVPAEVIKAYSYIRFSTPQQKLGDSLRRQTEKAAKYAAEHGLRFDTRDDALRYADELVKGLKDWAASQGVGLLAHDYLQGKNEIIANFEFRLGRETCDLKLVIRAVPLVDERMCCNNTTVQPRENLCSKATRGFGWLRSMLWGVVHHASDGDNGRSHRQHN